MGIYKSNNNYTLYLGDVLETLKEFPSNSIDMIFTSPPYNLGLSNSKGDFKLEYDNYADNMEYEEYIEWQEKILNECFRILTPNGSMFYNHKERFINGEYFNPFFYIKNSKFNIYQTIIWYRNSCFNFSTGKFGNTYENIYWLYKKDIPKIKINHSVMTDVWQINPDKNNNHPAPFPLELPLRAIYSVFDNEKGKTILDIFNGSGTTGVASLLLDHKYIGIDISKTYLDMSINRLNNYKSESKKAQLELDNHIIKNEYKSARKVDNQINIFEFMEE